MILLVMMSLVFAGISSARSAARRVIVAAGTEEGLFSAFAQYDRDLFDQYGLLFIDASYDSGEPQYGKLLKEIRDDADYVIDSDRETLVGKNLLGLDVSETETALTGYVLAADDGGSAFVRQVCQQMKQQVGTAAIQAIQARVNDEVDQWKSAKKRKDGYTAEDAGASYEEDKSKHKGNSSWDSAKPVDPSPTVDSARKRGILALVVPDSRGVSAEKVDLKQFLSRRDTEQGMNMIPTGYDGSLQKMMELEFIVEDFPSFTDESDDDGLKYQVEYAIAGNYSDERNLRIVSNKLVGLRVPFNLFYILTHEDMRLQCEAVADAVCTALLVPAAAPALSFTLQLCWSYAESVTDVKGLLGGGRIPLIKDEDSWRLSFDEIISFGNCDPNDNGSGLDYEEYLRMLLAMKSEQDLTNAMMDLTEYNIRQIDGREDFRLDCCIDALRVEVSAYAGQTEYTCERSYGYDMET
jgi:hypothetical protein